MASKSTAIPKQTCWSCRHFLFTGYDSGYSEYTPGTDFSIACGKNQWAGLDPREYETDFGKAMEIGFTCKKFKKR